MKKLLIIILAALTAYPGKSQSWNIVGGSTDGEVMALTTYNNNLIVGGFFALAGSTPTVLFNLSGRPSNILIFILSC